MPLQLSPRLDREGSRADGEVRVQLPLECISGAFALGISEFALQAMECPGPCTLLLRVMWPLAGIQHQARGVRRACVRFQGQNKTRQQFISRGVETHGRVIPWLAQQDEAAHSTWCENRLTHAHWLLARNQRQRALQTPAPSCRTRAVHVLGNCDFLRASPPQFAPLESSAPAARRTA